MLSHRRHQLPSAEDAIDGSARLLPNLPRTHTQLQHGCAGMPVDPSNLLHVRVVLGGSGRRRVPLRMPSRSTVVAEAVLVGLLVDADLRS
jgi:hypothetical protein